MKRIACMTIWWAWLSLFAGAASPPSQPAPRNFTLGNGLRVWIQEKPGIPICNFAFAFNVGVKDEEAQSSGMVHLLEHMLLFGGAGGSSGPEKNGRIRAEGGVVNAHTDHDLLTFEASFPADRAGWALQLLRENLFNPAFSPQELEGEKKIISQEISQIRDDPEETATSLLLETLFQKHPYGRPLFGNGEVIEKATIAQLDAMRRKYIVPANGSVAIFGDFKAAEMEERVRAQFGPVASGAASVMQVNPVVPPAKAIEIIREMDVHNCHLMVGFLAPSFDQEERPSMLVLSHILGRGINPLLASSVRRFGRPVDNASMRYLSLKYGGAAIIHLTLDPKNLAGVRARLFEFLKETGSFNYSEADYLPNQRMYIMDYLKSALGQMKLNSEKFKELGQESALYVSRYLLLRQTSPNGEKQKPVADVTSTELRRVASRFLMGKKYVEVVIVPGKAPDRK
jgi:predicted Zn-dependent peptidase